LLLFSASTIVALIFDEYPLFFLEVLLSNLPKFMVEQAINITDLASLVISVVSIGIAFYVAWILDQ